ncbi:helix-turn-helix domain-containing protein [Mannheimia sp. E30BD]|uniref:AlbA family DNA-binding domain-containing protein n=1 Tax=Mannheimia sp. E30BD TaxID=3278708 RepID=UPI00359ECAAB
MLTWDNIKQFLSNPTLIKEKTYLECKAAANSLPKDFWKSFSAFSNTQGGFILLVE